MRRIGDDVARERARFGPAGGMAEVVAAWPGAVGEAIARNAWPARIARDGTLHVATSSSTWAFELTQLAPTVLERLRAALGPASPSALRFGPGRLPEADAPDEGARAARPAPPGPQQRLAADRLVAGIDNEELRALVARAAAASLARDRSDRAV
jgi:hypothetical protein